MTICNFCLFVFFLFFTQASLAQIDTLKYPLSVKDSISLSFEVEDMDVDARGRIYLIVSGEDRIVRIHPNIKERISFGTTGFDLSNFDEPKNLDAFNGLKIYIADSNNRRISVFDNFQQPIGQLNFPNQNIEQILYPDLVQSLATGELLAIESESNTIVFTDRNGEARGWTVFPPTLSAFPFIDIAAGRNVWFVIDGQNKMVFELNSFGEYSRFFNLPQIPKEIDQTKEKLVIRTTQSIYLVNERNRIEKEWVLPPFLRGDGMKFASTDDGFWIVRGKTVYLLQPKSL